jgi:hypothetical protein
LSNDKNYNDDEKMTITQFYDSLTLVKFPSRLSRKSET